MGFIKSKVLLLNMHFYFQIARMKSRRIVVVRFLDR